MSRRGTAQVAAGILVSRVTGLLPGARPRLDGGGG